MWLGYLEKFTVEPLNGPIMEDPSICTGSFCRLCHGQFGTYFENAYQYAPSYARPTSATVRRAIAVRLSSPQKPTAKPISSRSKPRFEDLPAEIRLQIYRACLQPPIHPAFNISICGWVKGGGLHSDRNPYATSRYSSYMNIYASHRFPRTILVLNKRIYAEAVLEIYRNITFRIAGMLPFYHLPQVKYWLTAHPVRFATCLELPMCILFSGTRQQEYMSLQQGKTLTLDYMKQLARMVSKMPNLRQLNIALTLLLSRYLTGDKALHICANETLWQKRLFVLRSSLRESCKAAIIIKSERRIDQSRLQLGLTILASVMDGFEVQSKIGSGYDYSIFKNTWLLQIMKE